MFGNMFKQQQGGMFNFEPANPMLMYAGMGMLGGRNNSEAIQGAMRGAMLGQQLGLDMEERKEKKAGREAIQSYIGSQGLDPQTAAMLQANPQLAESYASARIVPTKQQPTSLMQNLQAAGLQPGTPEYRDAMLKASMPASTNVNVGAEKGYDKTLGEGYGKAFLEGQAEGRSAQSTLGSLNAMESAMADPKFYSGGGATANLALKRAIAALGGDPKAAASMENFQALAQKSALDSMGGSLGTGFSNADRDFVMNQVPNLDNTPEGNRQLIAISRAIQQRKVDIAKRAREYAKENGGRIDAGFDESLAAWAAENPLFDQPPPPPDRATLEEEARRRGLIR